MHIPMLILIILLCACVMLFAVPRLTGITDLRTRLFLCFLAAASVVVAWVSYVRKPASAPTPETSDLYAPEFSVAPGFYDSEFDVEITYRPGWDIYYTVDGSIPSAGSQLYQSPVHVYDRSPEDNVYRSIPNVTPDWYYDEIDLTPVSKAFVLRAVAVDRDGHLSGETTATYFVGQEPECDAVVSLVADPDDLFGPEGIYSTGAEYDEWYTGDQEEDAPEPNFNIHGLECPANLELFMDDRLYMAQPVGLRVQGGSQRVARLKRLSVFSRKKYSGRSSFYRELFEGKDTHSFCLRSGFENAFSMYLAQGRYVSVQESFPVTVYLNGEYWYDTYLQEKYNERFFRETYDVRQVEFVKFGITDEITEYLNDHDLSKDADYAGFADMVDIQSFIDFLCFNIYLGNADYSDMGNIAMWRTVEPRGVNQYDDGRWRYCLYDMDLETTYIRYELGLDDISDAEYDSFHYMADWSEPICDWTMFKALKANEGFRRQFVLSFMDIVNTCFERDRVEAMLKEWGRDMSYNDYFFDRRAEYITGYMADEFGLTGSLEPVTVSSGGTGDGTVSVNTAVPDLSHGSWTGSYFTDYPIELTAKPGPGSRFVRWEGDISSEDAHIMIDVPDKGIDVRAVFADE